MDDDRTRTVNWRYGIWMRGKKDGPRDDCESLRVVNTKRKTPDSEVSSSKVSWKE